MTLTKSLRAMAKPRALFISTATAMIVGLAGTAASASNAPPPGHVILDLDGSPIPHDFTLVTTQFTATSTFTDLAFAFRDDPSHMAIDDVLMTDGGGNLLVNGDFEQGPDEAHAPAGWAFDIGGCSGSCGLTLAGQGRNESFGYFDGSSVGYDTITQRVATVVGRTYNISFWLKENSEASTFVRGTDESDIDLLVYANSVGVSGAPEPAAWALMIGGFGLAGTAMRRRRTAAAA